jgi:hypothetical protein
VEGSGDRSVVVTNESDPMRIRETRKNTYPTDPDADPDPPHWKENKKNSELLRMNEKKEQI